LNFAEIGSIESAPAAAVETISARENPMRGIGFFDPG
jgi:hypothetical protein